MGGRRKSFLSTPPGGGFHWFNRNKGSLNGADVLPRTVLGIVFAFFDPFALILAAQPLPRHDPNQTRCR